jgi:Domain of unknown function (DUF4440)
MKRGTHLILLIGLVLFTSCQPEKKTEDPEILKSILTEYFDGIKKRDITKMNAVTTTDFLLFEDGKVWTNDSLINIMNQFKSFEGSWKFDNMKVNIDDLSGDIVYFNHGDFVFNDTTKMQFDWIESATFRKIDGKWKMNFLHSTVRK